MRDIRGLSAHLSFGAELVGRQTFLDTITVAAAECSLSRRHGDTEMNENEIGSIIVDCAIQLHKALGPGLLESVYEAILTRQYA